MATTKSELDFILKHLGFLEHVTYRPMMGEYLLYYDSILFGGIYDGRLLIKHTDINQKYNLPEVIPYDHAKPMYFVETVENQKLLKNIILNTAEFFRKAKK